MENTKKSLIEAPETKEGRVKRLEEVKDILKSEFVGLSDIIDEIIQSIETFYVTPEVQRTCSVVSLIGMTGTGKTSLVKRVTELLGLSRKTLYFDCGNEAGEDRFGNGIVSKTCDLLGIDSDSTTDRKGTETLTKDLVFILDEFHYAKTKDENTNDEIIKGSLRPIWKLIDDGLLDISDSYNYEYVNFCTFLEDFEPLASRFPDIKVEKNVVEDPSSIKIILETVGPYLYPWREIPSLVPASDDSDDEEIEEWHSKSAEEKEDEAQADKNPYRPLKIVSLKNIKMLIKKLNAIDFDLGKKTIQSLYSATTLKELYDVLTRANKFCNAPKYLDCSKALVFTICNLDEAFQVAGDLNPDVDADTFNDITSKISVTDIKNALMKRFRVEQIARLGNNLIKYPTLRKEHFAEIIRREVSRILNDFKQIDPIKVEIDPIIYNLLYSEGVFPTQGVRPVFTTVGRILTSCLSKVIIDKRGSDKVLIGIKNAGDWVENEFKVPTTTITLTFSDGHVTECVYNLQLGALRNPKSRATRYCNAVHEAGHAVMYSLLTGNAPSSIVAVSTDRGGFCSTYNPDKEGEIQTRGDIDNDIMISLAGYQAEKLIFGDSRPDMCLMGSSSDISGAWESLSYAALRVGYFEPLSFTNYVVQQNGDGLPDGLSIQSELIYRGDTMTLEQAMRKRWDELKEETYKNLFCDRKLIKKLALYLGKHGSMTSDVFLEYVKKYGNNLSESTMEHVRKRGSADFYLKCLGEEEPNNDAGETETLG